MTFNEKTKTLMTSIVTWATFAASVVTGIVAELRVSDSLPDNWTGPVIAVLVPLSGVLIAATAVIKRVMAVPAEGMQVVAEDGEALDVHRGWDPPAPTA